MWRSIGLPLALLLWSLAGPAHPALGHNATGESERLPTIGPAPDFLLTS
jgi:hypothetical protein